MAQFAEAGTPRRGDRWVEFQKQHMLPDGTARRPYQTEPPPMVLDCMSFCLLTD